MTAIRSAETAAAAGSKPRRRGLAGVTARLTAANIVGSATGFVTGPLLARALGAAGRGDLAAITVPLTLAPGLVGLGIASYAYREIPARRNTAEVIGSLGIPLVLLGAIVAAASVPLADVLAAGRATVRMWLIVVFAAMPVLVVGNLLLSSLAALELWGRVAVCAITPFLTALVGVVLLDLCGDLTVGTAAAATIAGSLLCLFPALPLLLAQRPRFRAPLTRAGLRFGIKSWVGGLAGTANGRLDQLLMITQVPPRELGLYAVAATIAGASGLASGGLSPPLMTRVASGERHLMAQAVRIMLLATALFDLALAAATPALLSVLFGAEFRGAFLMAVILLAAQVWLTAANVLSSALQADGAPLIPTLAELIALIVTVGGLLLLLGPWGGIGAAVVSFVAYGTSFGFQVAAAHRRLALPFRDFLIPTKEDLAVASSRLKQLLAPFRTRLARR